MPNNIGRPQKYPPNIPRVRSTYTLEGGLKEKFRKTCARNGRTMQYVMNQLAKMYVEQHADSEQLHIDNFRDPQFIGAPALFAPTSIWNEFLRNKCTPSDLVEIMHRAKLIESVANEIWINTHHTHL